MPIAQDSSQELGFTLSMDAKSWLGIQVGEILNDKLSQEVGLTEDDFNNFGRITDGNFTPYKRPEESFATFIERECGLQADKREIVINSLRALLDPREAPISANDYENLISLEELFTPAEVDAIQAYSLAVGDEAFHQLALTYEALGKIQPGQVNHLDSPITGLHEQADLEINEFFQAVKQFGDAIYGFPTYFQIPETNPNTVKPYKDLDIIYSEPKPAFPGPEYHPVWSIRIQGDTVAAKDETPITPTSGYIDLLVTDPDRNLELTTLLLTKRHLLRYWVGIQIKDIQKEKFKHLKYLISGVCYYKQFDQKGIQPPWSEPTKNPAV